MARQYALKSFLRSAPNHLLSRYLKGKGLTADLDWGSLTEAGLTLGPGGFATWTDAELDTEIREICAPFAVEGGRWSTPALFRVWKEDFERNVPPSSSTGDFLRKVEEKIERGVVGVTLLRELFPLAPEPL